MGQIRVTNYPIRVGKLPQTVTPHPTGVPRDLLRLFLSLTSPVRSPCPDTPESSQELWVIQWAVSEVTMRLGAGTVEDTLLPLCLFSLSLSLLKSLHLLSLSFAHENLAVLSTSLFNLTHSFIMPVLFPFYQRLHLSAPSGGRENECIFSPAVLVTNGSVFSQFVFTSGFFTSVPLKLKSLH